MHVVLVEDDATLADSLAIRLRAEGHEVDVLDSADKAVKRGIQRSLDIMLLDLGLQNGEGMAVIEALRRRCVHVPILALSESNNTELPICALSAGADDVVLKPVVFKELDARLRSLVRRCGGPRWVPSSLLPILLRDDLVVEWQGKTANLSPREYALLTCLLRHHGEILARDQISKLAFEYELGTDTNLVDVHLMHLRRKLDGFPIRLESVRGRGIRATSIDDCLER